MTASDRWENAYVVLESVEKRFSKVIVKSGCTVSGR